MRVGRRPLQKTPTVAPLTDMTARTLTPMFMVALASLQVGCAALHPRAQLKGVNFQPFAELNDADKARETFRSKLEASLAPLEKSSELARLSPEVMVIERSLPPGVTLKDGVIATTPESGLRVLGELDVYGQTANPFGFPDYESVGRKVLCYPQAPLSWVTLGIWSLVVPINWPCWGKGIERAEGVGLLRAAAAAAGADVIILTTPLGPGFGGARAFILKASTASSPETRPSSTSLQRVGSQKEGTPG